MTKIAILGDTHFGVKQDSKVMLDYQQDFFEGHFFPELDSRGISHIVHMGDLVDRRKYVNFQTLSRFREFFLDRLGPYETHIVCGNHDVFFRSTNRINSLDELCVERGINVHTWPKTQVIAGTQFAILPWMNKENQEEWAEVLTTSSANYCLGHLEISGFLMTRGYECDHGWKPTVFGRFDRVFSGHFHIRSEKKNILYVGTPYDLDWNDYDVPKGFHVFDTEDGSIEFVESPKKLFHKIYIDDEEVNVDALIKNILEDAWHYHNAFVKIYVTNRWPISNADKLLECLEENCEPADVKVIDHAPIDANTEGSRVVSSIDDTLTMLKKSVDARDLADKKKSHLKRILVSTYEEAQGLDK